MTARKLDNTNLTDLLDAYWFATCGETIHLETAALNPYEYAGYTAANLIPGLNDTDWEVIYNAVNEAVEKAGQGDPKPESILFFNIPSRALLAVVELDGYVPTPPGRNQGYWTSVRARLIREKKQLDKKTLERIKNVLMSSKED
jgi:hypothetical protein|nr:MAG TPA: hypothetical protein [Caudoviricetes sp.]